MRSFHEVKDMKTEVFLCEPPAKRKLIAPASIAVTSDTSGVTPLAWLEMQSARRFSGASTRTLKTQVFEFSAIAFS
jgi:hypothetical protein